MSNFRSNKNSIDHFSKELNDLVETVENLDGSTVSFDVLFNTNFMNQHTKTCTFDKFLVQGNFKVETGEDFEAIPDEEFDKYVSVNTDFSSWEDMLETATDAYLEKQLGL